MSTPNDLAAEFHRDLEKTWPELMRLLRDPDALLHWIEGWRKAHGVSEDEFEEVMRRIDWKLSPS